MKHPLTFEEFKYIYSKVPRLNVEVLVKTSNGLVLAERNIDPWMGYWHIPGGTVHMGEMPEDAVKRIALDEIGVNVDVKEMLGYIAYPGIKEQNGIGWPIGIAFRADIISGTLRGSDVGRVVKEFRELPSKIIPEQKAFIEHIGLI